MIHSLGFDGEKVLVDECVLGVGSGTLKRSGEVDFISDLESGD